MRLLFLLPMALLASGCAFYEKNYVSEIELEGTNYRGKIFDEGVFYINAEPVIKMRMGCYASTRLGATMSLLIPLPILNEIEPHNSIASEPFTLTLSRRQRDELDLSDLPIAVQISGRSHPLRLVRQESPEYTYETRYVYATELACGEVQQGVLTIGLASGEVRRYGVHFQEGVKREFDWHPDFVT